MNKVVKWIDVSYIIASEYRKNVLNHLTTPKTPSILSKELNLNIAHISRTLAELEEKKMIECLTPTSNKGKLYVIGDYGKKILNEILKF